VPRARLRPTPRMAPREPPHTASHESHVPHPRAILSRVPPGRDPPWMIWAPWIKRGIRAHRGLPEARNFPGPGAPRRAQASLDTPAAPAKARAWTGIGRH
jgi:hypothetical protein